MKRLFLDKRWIASADNMEHAIARCRMHPEDPLTLDEATVWKRNNLHLSWYCDEAGEYQGWTNAHPATADKPFKGEKGAWRITSSDGLHWETVGGPTRGMTVIRDEAEPDPDRRYKTIGQCPLVLGDDGEVVAGPDQPEELIGAYESGRKVEHGMVVASSPDGMEWRSYSPVVLNTYRDWHPKLDMGRNPDGTPRVEHKWWKPGAPGWAGGDSFPCLVYLPDEKKYVAFYRTNIDRRTSLKTHPGRRERGVGRSESADFTHWTPHELALRSDVDWQDALGHGKHDFYQMQVWPVAGVYLGIVSVFYWEEDRNRLELAWSPDTIHWERVCPYNDFIPHGELGEFGGGCSYAAMRPQEIDGDVRVYYGADVGRHNADSDRESTLMLALFKPDRFAGVAAGGMATGKLTTQPLTVADDALRLNLDALQGEVRVELLDESGRPLAGHTLEACDTIRVDELDAVVSWGGNASLAGLKGRDIRLRLVIRNATLYALEL